MISIEIGPNLAFVLLAAITAIAIVRGIRR